MFLWVRLHLPIESVSLSLNPDFMMGVELQSEGAGPGIAQLPASAVLAQLERMVASAAFDVSDRHRNFLSYVVHEKLQGHADRIKAYSIATSVFGREADFDPQVDPIVRIEAGRLRRALDHYYLTSGATDPVLITIPKGSYVPIFEVNTLSRPDADPIVHDPSHVADPHEAAVPVVTVRNRPVLVAIAALIFVVGIAIAAASYVYSRPEPSSVEAWHGPVILVLPFTSEGQSSRPDVAAGLTREVISGLTRFNDLMVFGPETSFRQPLSQDVGASAAKLGADYLVTGTTTALAESFRASVALIDAETGQYVWSGTFRGRLVPEDLFATEDQIATEIVQILAQPYGVIFGDQVKELRAGAPSSLSSYECVLQFLQYWKKADRQQFAGIRHCLEHAIVEDPGYALAHSKLALLYCDAARYGFDRGKISFDPLARAFELANRAVELEPRSAHGYQALHLIYWLRNDVDSSLRAAEQGLELNPNDTELMADLGGRAYVAGQWERYALITEAMARNPALSDFYRVATYLHAYRSGDYRKALTEAKRINLANISYGYIAIAAAAGQLGHRTEAEEAVRKILELDPAFTEHAVAFFKKHNLHPELTRGLVDGLRKAGMNILGHDI